MGKTKKKGRAVKRARQKFGLHFEQEEMKLAPHTMVIHRGEVGKEIRELIQDMRKVMEPFTASALKVSKKNTLKDFVSIAGPMHVTHLIVFTKTDISGYMKIIRMPRGPTLSFKVHEFTPSNEVLQSLKKKHTHQKQYLHQPLLILNGFNARPQDSANGVDSSKVELHHKLLATTLQNMFPSINVTKIKLNEIRRCVLFNYNKDDQTIDFRQYNIKLVPVGISRTVKKLIQERLPNLSNFQDISELIENGGNFSESEAEFDGPENEVNLTQDVNSHGSVNLKSTTSAIRLSEIGPRLKLKLIKIEEGICDGEVLYHDFIQKSPKEMQELRESLKIKRKREKEEKKKEAVEKKINERINKKSGKRKREDEEEDGGSDYDEDKKMMQEEDGPDDDAEYYKQELGQAPTEDFFDRRNKKKKREGGDDFLSKSDRDVAQGLKEPKNNGSTPQAKKMVSFEGSAKRQPKEGFESKSSNGRNNKNASSSSQQNKPKFLRFSKKKKDSFGSNK